MPPNIPEASVAHKDFASRCTCMLVLTLHSVFDETWVGTKGIAQLDPLKQLAEVGH